MFPKLNASATGFRVKHFVYNFSSLLAFLIPQGAHNKAALSFHKDPDILLPSSFLTFISTNNVSFVQKSKQLGVRGRRKVSGEHLMVKYTRIVTQKNTKNTCSSNGLFRAV